MSDDQAERLSSKTTNLYEILLSAGSLLQNFTSFAGRSGIYAVALMLGASLSEGLSLALLAPLLGVLTGQGGPWLQATSARAFSALNLTDPTLRLSAVLLAFVAAFLLRSALIAGRDALLSSLQIGFVDARRVGLIARLASSSWQDTITLRHARVTQALSIDIPMMAMSLNLIVAVMVGTAMLLVQLVLVFLLSPQLGAVAIIVAAGTTLASLPVLRQASALGWESKRGSLELLSGTSGLLGSLKSALAQNLSGAFVSEVKSLLNSLAGEHRRYNSRRSRLLVTSSGVTAVALAAFVATATLWRLPIATLLTTLAVLSRMVGPGQIILQNSRHIAQSLPFCASLGELECELAGGDLPNNVERGPPEPIKVLRFEHVSFGYRGATDQVVTDLDLIISPGDILGVTGASGSGKTTFIDLLCGLLVPSQGRVTVGGAPLAGEALTQFRGSLAYVAQDPHFFNDTIRRNLSWGCSGVDDDALWEALVLTGLQEKVRQIGGDLDATIAERGVLLSGGERQRLALARAFLRRPSFLILDEATNALDAEAEYDILDKFFMMANRPTIVMVTHRTEALRFCTRVLGFADGRMRELESS